MGEDFHNVAAKFLGSVSSPALRAVVQHWIDVCKEGRLPAFSELRPSKIKKHLPIVWSYEYLPSEDDFVGRLAGHEITGISNKPFKGSRLSELRPADNYPRSLVRAEEYFGNLRSIAAKVWSTRPMTITDLVRGW